MRVLIFILCLSSISAFSQVEQLQNANIKDTDKISMHESDNLGFRKSITAKDLRDYMNIFDTLTYSELVTKIANSELAPGQKYLLEDYQTVHYFMDGDVTLTDINTGPIEPLVVTALTSNTISNEVSSLSYNQDVIYYDWNALNWTSNLSFSIGSVIIPNFKGVITYRKDVAKNIECFYDFRNVKYRRWQLVYAAHDPIATYNKRDLALYNNVVYLSIKDNNINILPTDGTFWIPILNVTTHYSYVSPKQTLFNGMDVNSNFVDYYTFNYDAYNVKLGPSSKANIFLSNFVFLPSINNVNKANDVVIGSGYGNTMIGYYYGNNIGANSNYNLIGHNFYFNNIFNDFRDNIYSLSIRNNFIGNFSYDNVIGQFFRNNNITSDFRQNYVGNNAFSNTMAPDFRSNNVGFNCIQNTFPPYCVNNVIGNDMKYNVFRPVFSENVVGNGFTLNFLAPFTQSVNFTGATHVYNASYQKDHYKRQDGQIRLVYIDNTDTEIIVPATN